MANDVHAELVPYTGKVYGFCVPPHHLIRTRRNGCEQWTGNSGRDIGGYTADQTPGRGGSRGAKRMSGFDVNALLAHGATEVLKDSHLVRGTRNEDYWNALRMGRPLPEPTVPFIYDKFINTLKAGGINTVKKGDIISIMPLVNADIEKASNGEIKSSEQVEAKNLEPIPGGLFDPKVTGGINGSHWSHVTLSEPLPNPVMEEAIRRLLGLRVQDYLDVIAGKQAIDGLSGGKGIERALRKIDVPERISSLKSTVMTARGQKRDDAVKALRFLWGAQKQGINPGDWVIDKVPILPPKFRPVSVVGDMIRAADMNGLYRDLIETNNSIKKLRGQVGEQDLADEKIQLYQAVQAAFGVGDPITPEGESKRWHGAIRQVIGSSPKFGMFQSKMLSKTVDVVGRGVVTPDPNLDMDQLGIPEDKAWELYRPFVQRRLVRRGFPPVKAAQMVEKRSKEAEDELQREMEDRPVIMDRAPTWHKFNLLAFHPHVVKENVLRVSPLITAGLNMDFDGDQANFHVPVTTKAVEEAKEKMLPSKNLFRITDLKSVMHAPGKEMVMGLYQLTRDPAAKKAVVFKNARDAKRAYEQGLIGANDPVTIQEA